ncbi:MAG: glycine cleavage system protein T, partial [Dehalococcoidia bacterium]
MVEHRGADALDLLHRLTTKSLIDLEIGKSERTILTSNRGRVVDAFDVARVDDEVLI